MKHPLNTCLSWAMLWPERWPRCHGGSRVRCGLPRANSRPGCGGLEGTAALKPRPTHSGPIRATDVHDVIQKGSGGCHRASQPSPPWSWQQLCEVRGLGSWPPFLFPAAWLGSGISSSSGVGAGVNSSLVLKPALPAREMALELVLGPPLCPHCPHRVPAPGPSRAGEGGCLIPESLRG